MISALFSCNLEQENISPNSSADRVVTFHYNNQTFIEALEEGKQNNNPILAKAFSNPQHVIYIPIENQNEVYVFDAKADMEQYFDDIFNNKPVDETCTATVTLYEHKNYQGASLRMCNSVNSLGSYSFNDKASSMIISNTSCATNWYVGLYKDANYGGPAVYIGSSTGESEGLNDFDDVKFHNFFGIKYGKINDKISSVSFIDGSNCTPYYEGSTTNKALNAYASASSTFSGYSASKVNDGSRNTTVGGAYSWTNAHTYGGGLGGDGKLPEYVQLTFNSSTTVSRINMYSSSGYVIRDYQIQYRNAFGQWITVVDQNGNTSVSRTHIINPVSTNAIRLYAEKGPNNQSIYARVNELEVY